MSRFRTIFTGCLPSRKRAEGLSPALGPFVSGIACDIAAKPAARR
ncbi:MAG: hypothetical protein AB7U20_07025 [Planctomycetaceae bacterium]